MIVKASNKDDSVIRWLLKTSVVVVCLLLHNQLFKKWERRDKEGSKDTTTPLGVALACRSNLCLVAAARPRIETPAGLAADIRLKS